MNADDSTTTTDEKASDDRPDEQLREFVEEHGGHDYGGVDYLRGGEE